MESKTFKCCACLFTSILIFSRGQCNEIEFCEEVASVCENFPKIKHSLKEITEMCLQKLNDETEAKKYSVSKPFEFQFIGKMMDDVVQTLNRQRSSTIIKKTKVPDKSSTRPKYEVHHKIKVNDIHSSTELFTTERSSAIPQHHATTAIFKDETVPKENETAQTETESASKNINEIIPLTPLEYVDVISESEIDIPLEDYGVVDTFESTSKNIASTTLVYEKAVLKPKDKKIKMNETVQIHAFDISESRAEKNSSLSEDSDARTTEFTTQVNSETTEINKESSVLYTDEYQHEAYDPLLSYNRTLERHEDRVASTIQTEPPAALTIAGFNSKLLWCMVFLAATLIAFTVPVLYNRTKKRFSGAHYLEEPEVQYTP